MMNQMMNALTRLPLSLLLTGTMILSACGEGSTKPEEDHAEEVEGVMLVLSGQTIASYDGETGRWSGALEVAPGEETAYIAVRFVEHNGSPVSLDDDNYLEVQIEDESIAEFEQDTPGEFGGHLHGVAEGETEVVFMLMHGALGAGHADFVTAPVDVHVEP